MDGDVWILKIGLSLLQLSSVTATLFIYLFILYCSLFIMQITLQSWLKRRRVYRIGLYTMRTSMREVLRKGPLQRYLSLHGKLKSLSFLNFLIETSNNLEEVNCIYRQVYGDCGEPRWMQLSIILLSSRS